jgi:membrane-associated phospholipid phosphatase
MKVLPLAIGLVATVFFPALSLQAAEYFSSNLQVSLATADGTNGPAEHRDYLLSYTEEDWPRKYLEWLWKDPANLFTRPAFWSGGQWATFGIEAGITGALFPLDRSYRDFSDDIHNKPLNHVLKPIDFWYGNYPLALYSAGMFGGGLILHNEKLADTGFLSAESIGYASALDLAIKEITQRERPRSTHDPYDFHGPGGSIGTSSSFVSGDTIVAFAFASSVSEIWQTPWVTWPLYLLAASVAFERTEFDAHWLTDVVGAAFLGHAVGKTIVRMHYRHGELDGRLTPYVGDHAVGLQLTFEF